MPLAPHRQTPSAFSDAAPLEAIARPLPSHTIPPHALFDLVIIGAGPGALAVIARILESRPAALYTEQEHHFLHWLNKSSTHQRNRGQGNGSHGSQQPHNLRLVRTKASGRGAERVIVGESTLVNTAARASGTEPCPCPGEMKILVVDKVGQGWMAHWHNMFKALEIQRGYPE